MSRILKIIIADILLLALLGGIVYFKGVPESIRRVIEERGQAGEDAAIDEQIEQEDESEEEVLNLRPKVDGSEWSLVLVNPWNRIPDDYFDSVEIVETEGGYEIDSRVRESLEAMLADCRKAGHSPVIISSFRTRELQQYLYDRTANKDDTAFPGTSEHECGLAVDILEEGYGDDWADAEKTAETETQKWLTDNCQNYGFILRYPKGKEDITGIVYESWHYRYVGVEHAMRIMESGQCLEEYLGRIDSDKEKIQSN